MEHSHESRWNTLISACSLALMTTGIFAEVSMNKKSNEALEPSIKLNADSDLQKGFMNRPDYFLAPTTVQVAARGTPNAAEGSLIQIYHNGTEVAGKTQIDALGLHEILIVERTPDDVMNTAYKAFEIRERSLHPAKISVMDMAVSRNDSHLTEVVTSLFLTSDAFDVSTIFPETINLWFEKSTGEWIRASADPAIAEYSDCAYELIFVANMETHELDELPETMVLTGRGFNVDGPEYTFLCNAKRRNITLNWTPPCVDDSETNLQNVPLPEPRCLWHVDQELMPVDKCNVSNPIGGTNYDLESTERLSLYASGSYLGGSGHCFVNYTLPKSVSASCSVESGIVYRYYYESPEAPCCTTCKSMVRAAPTVSGMGQINPTASVNVAASVSVAVAGGGSVAAGNMTLKSSGGGSYSVGLGPFGITTPIASGATIWSFSEIAKPPYANTIRECEFEVVIQTAGQINLNARSGFLNWFASADGRIYNCSHGTKVQPGNDCSD